MNFPLNSPPHITQTVTGNCVGEASRENNDMVVKLIAEHEDTCDSEIDRNSTISCKDDSCNNVNDDSCNNVNDDSCEVDYIYFFKQNGKKGFEGDSICRTLVEKCPIRIGRKTLKTSEKKADKKEGEDKNAIWLLSKVVSRTHAEVWIMNGTIYIKDMGSSSGTFLNGIRLSPSVYASRPYSLTTGDVVQFGIDYKWSAGELYHSVIFKVVIERFNLKELHLAECRQTKFSYALNSLIETMNPKISFDKKELPSQKQNPSFFLENCQPVECSLCLGTFGPSQAIFLSPCSHCYHYCCVSQILTRGIMFQCPLCRQYANLDASVNMDPHIASLNSSMFENTTKSAPTIQNKPQTLPSLSTPPTPTFSPTTPLNRNDCSSLISFSPIISTDPSPISNVSTAITPTNLRNTNNSDINTPQTHSPPVIEQKDNSLHSSAIVFRELQPNNRHSTTTPSLHDTNIYPTSLHYGLMIKFLNARRSLHDKIFETVKRKLCSIKVKESNNSTFNN